MTTVEVRVQLTLEEVLKAVGQLNTPELEAFVQDVLALRTQRQISPSEVKEYSGSNCHDTERTIFTLGSSLLSCSVGSLSKYTWAGVW